MPKILKKNTAILQVPEKVINDKNKLVNSITNKGNLTKDTIKIQIGETLKVVSKGTSIEQQKEPEIFKARYGSQKFPIIIKPLTKKELIKQNYWAGDRGGTFVKIDSIEKFNSLKFDDKVSIENNVNFDLLNEISQQFVNDNYNGAPIFSINFNEAKFNKAADKYTDKFYKIINKLRKKSKIEFLDWFGSQWDFEQYRFIF